MLKATLLAATLSLIAAPLAVADTGFDVSGKWNGKGFVQKDEKSRKMNVTCEVTGARTGDAIGFEGQCRAMLVMKRAIGADLVENGDTYSGTYIGSRVGPADLKGAMEGTGKLVMQMTFPKTVNGDDIATMTIEMPSDDAFTITTVDMMEDGSAVTTADITFERDPQDWQTEPASLTAE